MRSIAIEFSGRDGLLAREVWIGSGPVEERNPPPLLRTATPADRVVSELRNPNKNLARLDVMIAARVAPGDSSPNYFGDLAVTFC
jgi:hypothetical protein